MKEYRLERSHSDSSLSVLAKQPPSQPSPKIHQDFAHSVGKAGEGAGHYATNINEKGRFNPLGDEWVDYNLAQRMVPPWKNKV